ncbi:enoyl-CoA hydratase-related protein [Acidocella sp.]|jgi:2-(1,2-epoxy-1,2-dihydrophenyl)acetyl-CoA isomerase|uniref:enoyl-CoA hydratase-related protein n=1 Tax=Acidocella sp. TaxID=50710 RepID=UPI002F42A4C9
MTTNLLVETEGAVRRLVLNRPERLNALDAALLTALNEAFAAAEADPAVRAVLLTGAGRGFCAGADLQQNFGATPPDLGAALEASYNPLVRRMRSMGKPILCAVNGVAAGAGMNLALAADIVIAARSANFSQAFIRIGLVPDAGGTYFLPRLVGEGRARALAMLGETLTAAQAEAMGLVWKLFDDEHLPAEALAMAKALADKPAGAMAATKRAFAAAAVNGLDAQLAWERDTQQALGRSADFAEGIRAFAEKRPAVFNK